MIYRTLISCGYLDAAVAMERECNVGLTQWEMADNMDLYYIIQDFEEYFEIKFQKKPVFVKKNPNADDELKNAGRVRKPPAGGMLPKITSASNLSKQNSNRGGAGGSSNQLSR